MPTLTIKRMSDDRHERLKERTERHRRSMDEEVLMILEDALMPSRRNAETAIAQAEALNREIGKAFNPRCIEEGKREGSA